MIAQFHKGKLVKASPIELEERVVYDTESLKTLKDFVSMYNNEFSSINRNQIKGGNLITKSISEVCEAISNGTFEGLGIGDYFEHQITLDNTTYTLISQIAHFDPYFQYDDHTKSGYNFAINQHHLALYHMFYISNNTSYVYKMNKFSEPNNNATGYYGSSIQEYLSNTLFPHISKVFNDRLISRNMNWSKDVVDNSVIYKIVDDYITLPTPEQMGFKNITIDRYHEGYFKFELFNMFNVLLPLSTDISTRAVHSNKTCEIIEYDTETTVDFYKPNIVTAITILS